MNLPAGLPPMAAASLTVPLHLRGLQASAVDRRLGAAAAEFPRSLLRGTVTAASLAAGQFALGERDRRLIALRAITGAVLTEMTGLALRWANDWGDTEEDERALVYMMLTYGEAAALQWAYLLAAVRPYRHALAQGAPPR